jgi:hypothetical protein
MRSQLMIANEHDLRRSRRFPIAAPLRYRISNEDDWRTAQTENISSTGVLFRCEKYAEQGAQVEMNFLLLKSSSDPSGLEVACKGEVVRLDLTLGEAKLPALAVKITGYWLGPGKSGRWDIDCTFRKFEGED